MKSDEAIGKEEDIAESIDYAALKRGGIMRQREKGLFSLRLHLAAGTISTEQIRKIAELADRCGKGYIHLTARQGIEIPFVRYADIEKVREELSKKGVGFGACGPRVRTVTGCQGNTVCPHGIIETTNLCHYIDREFYGKEAPHKFKFSVSGCINSCLKPQENDCGIMGVVEPEWSMDDCSRCGVCQEVCRSGAIEVKEEGVFINRKLCVLCGDCIASCPTSSWQEKRKGYLVFVGGKWGRRPVMGKRIGDIIEDKEELMVVMRRVLKFYGDHGKKGERFAQTLERTGFEALEKEAFG